MVPKRVSASLQRRIDSYPCRGPIFAACLLLCPAAFAGQDEDLNLIPQSASFLQNPPTPAPKSKWHSFKFFAEAEGQLYTNRDHVIVAVPDAYLPSWGSRLTLYGKADIRMLPSLSLTIVDRLNHLSDEHSNFPSGKVQNDLNEAYLSWNVFHEHYLDVGRINLKSGVAIGFNPTDFFKKNAVSIRISEDPLVLRENRLGTLMARWQSIIPLGSLTLAAAPGIPDRRGRWITDGTSGALWLQRTNPAPRYLAKVTASHKGFNSDLSYYNEDKNSFLGADLSHGIGDRWVMYGEWSGGRQYNIVTNALLDDAKIFGINAEPYTWVVPGDSRKRFRSQVATGFSFTESAHKRSTYVEYHYNEAGMRTKEWNYWYTAGYYTSYLNDPALAPIYTRSLETLWSIRDCAQRSMEPTSRHQLFVRNQWQEAFFKKLDLVNLFQINLQDGSFFAQPMGKYYLNDKIMLTLTLNFYIGPRKSEYGSINRWNATKLGITYFFN